MNDIKNTLKYTRGFQWMSFLLVLLIFAGYSLRSVIFYNFEQVFLLVLILFVYLCFQIKVKIEQCPRDLFVWSGFLVVFCFSVLALNAIHFPSADITDISMQKIQITLLIVGFLVLSWVLFLLKPPLDYFWYFLMVASVVMLVRVFMELDCFSLSCFEFKGRLGDKLGNPIAFGLFANTLFILMLGGLVWAYKKHPVLLCFWVLLLTLNLLMVILSQTRTAWLGWAEALIGWGGYYFYLAYRHKMLLKFGTVIALFMIVFIWISTILPVSKILEQRVSSVVTDIESYVDRTTPLTSVGMRLSIYESSINLIKEKPYFGHGSEAITEQLKEKSQAFFLSEFNLEHPGLHFSHAHNQFLTTWIQYGVWPVVLLLWLFIYLARYFWQGLRKVSEEQKPIFIAGLVFLVSMLVAFLVESPLEFATYSAHYWLFMTLLFVFSLLVKSNQALLDTE